MLLIKHLTDNHTEMIFFEEIQQKKLHFTIMLLDHPLLVMRTELTLLYPMSEWPKFCNFFLSFGKLTCKRLY